MQEYYTTMQIAKYSTIGYVAVPLFAVRVDCIKRREGGKLETVFLKKINKTTFMRVWRPLGFSPGVNGDWPLHHGMCGAAAYALVARRTH